MTDQDFKAVPFPVKNTFFKLRVGIFILYIFIGLYIATLFERTFAIFELQIIAYIWLIVCIILAPKIWRLLFPKKENTDIKEQLQYFISANKLYETETIEAIDRDGKPKREALISNYARFGYKENEDELIIRAYKCADKFSEKMNSFDTMLQSLTALPLNEKNDNISYCDYHFKKHPDKRLIVSGNNDKLEFNKTTTIPLNNNLSWRIDKQPHGLIAGVTGGGKTTFIFYLLIEFLKMRSTLYICDPKKSDLVD